MRYFINIFKLIFRGLIARKKRSFLAMLGIIIGVAAVIAIMSVGASAQDLLLSQIKSMGSNVIGIMPGFSEENAPPTAMFGIEITTLKYDDAMALKDHAHLIAVCPYVTGRGTVSYYTESEEFDYLGVNPDYLNVEEAMVAEGRFIKQEEVDGLSRVAVLGSEVKEEIFGNDSALNKRIKINQISFKVIGVMKKRGVVAFQNQDNQIFVPVKTAQKLLLGINHLGSIKVKVDAAENVNMAIDQIERTLRHRHHILDERKDDFSVRDTAQALDLLGTVTQAVKMFLAMVAAISLLVGGIGIMNIMFVIVNERTKEVGLRKSLGAKRSDILFQFLVESSTMTLLGGVMGIVTGVLIALVATLGVRYYGYDWQFIITPGSVIVAVLMAVSVGLIFGIWPAHRASKLNPIEALRYE